MVGVSQGFILPEVPSLSPDIDLAVPKPKQPFNPFYLLAMLFGIVFAITACAFGVMMLKSIRPEGLPESGAPGHGLMDLLSQHGTAILTAELAGLAVFTLPAIYLDHLRGRREVARRERSVADAASVGVGIVRREMTPRNVSKSNNQE
jgi:hypothetical protein